MILSCRFGREEQAIPRAGWWGWPGRHSPTGWAWTEMPMSPLQSEGVLGICLEGCRAAGLPLAAQ